MVDSMGELLSAIYVRARTATGENLGELEI